MASSRWILGAVALALFAACSSDPNDRGTRDDAGAGASNGDADGSGGSSGSGATGAGGTATGSGGTLSGLTGGSGGGTGEPEVCDGVDNDGNGIVDDVDEGMDGVCDCLRVATLGVQGTWGEGDVFADWLNSRSSDGAVDLADQVLTAELLEPFQVIVAQDLRGREYSASEVTALDEWINAGGGLMTLIGYGDQSERTNINLLLAPSGLAYGEQAILQTPDGETTLPITIWNEHATSTGVTQIGVDNGYPVTGPGAVVAEQGGFDVAHAHEHGDGKVFIWADEWITYNSEWTEHPEYQVELFWLNVLKWLTPIAECQVPIPPTVH